MALTYTNDSGIPFGVAPPLIAAMIEIIVGRDTVMPSAILTQRSLRPLNLFSGTQCHHSNNYDDYNHN